MTYQQEVWLRETRDCEKAAEQAATTLTRQQDESVEAFIARRRVLEDTSLSRLRIAREELRKARAPVLADEVLTLMDGSPL